MYPECGSCEYMGVDEAGKAMCCCLTEAPDWCPIKKEPKSATVSDAQAIENAVNRIGRGAKGGGYEW